MWETQVVLDSSHVRPFWIFLTGPLKSSLSLIGSLDYPDMWGVPNNLSISHNHEKVCQDYHSFENHPFYLFRPFLTFLMALWNPYCLWLVSSGSKGTLTCEESRNHWTSTITLKKVCQDCRLFWKSPFGIFGPFWMILMVPWKSFLCLIGFIRYIYMWGCLIIASLYHNFLFYASRLPL